MLKKLQTLSLAARIIGIVVILSLVGIVAYQLYDFYSDKIGYTPTRAIEDYFMALSRGDYETVYRLTSKTYLTDIYGRPITKGEFFDQLDKLTGGHRMPFRSVEATKIFERKGTRYYVVSLNSSVGGKLGQSRVLVEIKREGREWVITYPFAIIL